MNTRRRYVLCARTLLAAILAAGLLHGSGRPAAAATQTDIHGPEGSGVFGELVTELPNGNFVVTDPEYNGGLGAEAGAVYLYNGATGQRISTLTGSAAGNRVGSGGVILLSNGNYVVNSSEWDDGAAANVGAVTWGSQVSGVSGVVSEANSLVGSTANDQVGVGGVTALDNGNYVVNSPSWDNGGTDDVGAVTWGSGTAGISGPVTSANSLVGTHANDFVGLSDGVIELSNGNFVVTSYLWDNGTATDAGAVTWGDGTSGVSGEVSATNSLLGGHSEDRIGSFGIVALNNGGYVVCSPFWDNGGTADAGAATWGRATGGVVGLVSGANSLVGTHIDDQVGRWAFALSDEDYVVLSTYWDNGEAADAGAVTWGDGTSGISGAVQAGNSLIGGTAGDGVGGGGVLALSNGNYVVNSPSWDNGGTANVGAVTWGSGTGGISGLVSTGNSLVGVSAVDQVGAGGVSALSNGNYVVYSPYWNNGGVINAGAATWGNGTGGTTGPVTTANSTVGSTINDRVGSYGGRALSNGNYVVMSPYWHNGGLTNAGAVTWRPGNSGAGVTVSALNSLVGSTADDGVGHNVYTLSNGNYVAVSTTWDNAGVVDAGAVTWGDGTSGISGPVSAANSLVGSTAGDQVGAGGVTGLSDGDYVVRSRTWDNGPVVDAGAATWGSGTSGISGPVSSANSLVGDQAGDQAGHWARALSDGGYVLLSPEWDNGGAADAGAITWSFGASGLAGSIEAANSVRGTAAGGGIGMNFEHDVVNHQLVVGRPADNIVTLFRLVRGVSVTPPSGAKSGAPGATVSYTLQVSNTGDLEDSFSLAAGGSGWTTTLPAAVGPLAPGAVQNVTVSVKVPASAAGGSTDTATITVTSQAEGAKKDTAALTTTASNVYGLAVTPPTSAKSGAPGKAVSYTLQVANTGNTPASFNLAASGNHWAVSLPATVGPIAAGASQNVTVSVTVPASAPGGSTDTALVTVTCQAEAGKTASAALTTTAGARKIYMPLVRKK